MTTTQPVRPGEWFDTGMGLDDIDAGQFRMDISTDRYTDPAYVQLERDNIWMRVWQVVGRDPSCPTSATGRNTELSTSPSSWSAARTTDPRLRQRLPAPRERAVQMDGQCQAGHSSASTTCGPTTWTASLKGMLRENDLAGPSTRTRLALLQVLGRHASPDSSSSTRTRMPQPLAEFLGEEVDLLSPITSRRWTTVMDVAGGRRTATGKW